MVRKILLDIRDSALVLDFGENQEDAAASRTFFEFLLNFYYSQSQNKFISDKNSELVSKYRETVNFLKSRGLEYNLSPEAQKLESKISQNDQEFQKNIKDALAIKQKLFKSLRIKDFSRQLTGYQHKGFEHLIAIQDGANFSVPGSGKTTVAYAYFDHLVKNNIVKKLLVIGPRSSFLPWEEEYEYCFNKKPNIKRISGNIPYRQKIYNSAENYEIFLTTYQTASNDIENLISVCRQFDFLVVLDEAHYIKRFDGGFWARNILKLAPFARRRMVMTGTPAPNSYEDLWNQIYFLWPNKEVFENQASFGRMCKSSERLEELKKKIHPLFYRTTKKDLDLPDPKFEKIMVELGPLQKRIYDAIAVKFISELGESPEVNSSLREWRKAKMVRLIEASSNPTLLNKYSEEFRVPPIDSSNLSLSDLIRRYSQHEVPSKILILLDEIRKTCASGKKIIVWTNFILNIKMLSRMLREEGIEFARVYGEIPKDFSEDLEDNREKEIKRFKKDKNTLVLLANPAACSESISLHKICKTAVYLDRTFNCGQYLQSLDRIHRLGLSPGDKIIYKILLSKNTIDETIHDRLLIKAKKMEALLSEDLPIGAFDNETTDVVGNESEEERDFQAVMQDLISRHGNK